MNEDIFDLLTEGLLILDKDHRIIKVNSVFCHWSQKNGASIIGKYAEDVFPTLTDQKIISRIERCASTGLPENLTWAIHGQVIPFQIKGSDAKRSHNCRICKIGENLLLIFSDVTDLKKIILENEKNLKVLKKTKEEIESLVNLKTKFLGRVSRDVKNPINGILGGVEILYHEVTNKSAVETLDIIKTSCRDLISKVQNIQEYSKIVSKEINVKESDLVLEDILKEIVAEEKNKMIYYNNSFKINIEPDVPKRVLLDLHLFNIILSRLLSNSNKYTRNGLIEINLSVEEKKSNNVILKFDVKDNGRGFNISTDFEQYDPFLSSSDDLGGVGIGVPLVKEALKLLGGRFEIISNVDQGTLVTFMIPSKEISVVPKFKIFSESFKEISNLSEEFPLKILIVDDSDVCLLTESKLLSLVGYNVDTARDGFEAIEKCEKNKYDLIFLDHRMPFLSGIEVAKEITSDPKYGMPEVVILTGDRTDKLIEESKDFGIKIVLEKPFGRDNLLSTIFKLFKKEEGLLRLARFRSQQFPLH